MIGCVGNGGSGSFARAAQRRAEDGHRSIRSNAFYGMSFGGVRLNFCRAKYRSALSANRRGSRSPARAVSMMYSAIIARAAGAYSSVLYGALLACTRRHASSKASSRILIAAGSNAPSAYCLMKPRTALTRAYSMGGSDQPSPVAAIPFAASNGRHSTPLFIADYDIRDPALCIKQRAASGTEDSVGSERLRLVGLAALPIEMASLPAAKPIGADDVGICSAGFLAATSVLARLTAQAYRATFLAETLSRYRSTANATHCPPPRSDSGENGIADRP
jgi:hypothetical protein